MVNAVILGEGHLAVGSINRAGRGKHKVTQTWNPSTGFHQIHKPDEITVDVGEWILQGVTHTGLENPLAYVNSNLVGWILQGVTHTGLGRQVYNHFRFEIRNQAG